MVKRIRAGLLVAVLATTMILGFSINSFAVTSGPISLQHGFPLWMQDDEGNRVAICLDAACVPDPVIPGDAFSELIGFGGEAFWWTAGATLPGTLPGVGLVEFAMEAAWANEVPASGDWFPFTRIRIRFDVDVAGTYTLDHPYGTETWNILAADIGPGLEINESFDIVVGAPPDFVQGAAPGQIPTQFLAITGTTFVPGQVFAGAGTIPLAGTLLRNNVQMTAPAGSAVAFNVTDFDAAGLYFENAATPSPNIAPTAVSDVAGVRSGSTAGVIIDAAANDTDVIAAGTNDHGVNPLATAIGAPDLVGAIPLVNAPLGTLELVPGIAVATTGGGSVMKNSDGTFTYTPSPTFAGEDSFAYTIQDTGGMFATENVTIRVENLGVTRAALRVKTLKWDIAGQTTPFAAPHTMNLHLGADATGPMIGTADVQPDGSWSFKGGSSLNPGTAAAITCVSSNGAILANQPFVLR